MLKPKLLPVRLSPVPGEHFSAYLLRLAIANGRSSVRELLATIGIKGFKAQNHHSHDTVASLARYLGKDPSALRACIVRTGILEKIPARDDSRIYRNLEIPYPRICVACIQSGLPISAYAGQLPFTHCFEHRHELIHACPQCHALFEWSEELFECMCTACGSEIEQIGSAAKLPGYADKLMAWQENKITLNRYIGDLLLALQCVLDPLSSDLATREKPPAEPMHWPSLLNQAYSLLEDAETISAWSATCSQHRSVTGPIGKAAVYLPIAILREKLALRWRVHELDCCQDINCAAADIGCLERTPQLASVDHTTLSKALGCKPSEILPLLETGSIPCLRGHRSVRDARFDLAALAMQVTQLTDDTEKDDFFISIEWATHIATTHGAHTGHILAGILYKEIPFLPRLGRDTLLEGSQVGREGLFAYMAKHFLSLDSTQCTLQETIAITGLTEREIKQACTLGLIKPLGWKSSSYFLGRDLISLLRTHLSVRRWSKITGLTSSQVRNGLDTQRFSACIEGALYERSPALEAWLRIPRHSDTQPTLIRTPVPRSFGQAVGAQRRRDGIVSLGCPAASISSSACASIRP